MACFPLETLLKQPRNIMNQKNPGRQSQSAFWVYLLTQFVILQGRNLCGVGDVSVCGKNWDFRLNKQTKNKTKQRCCYYKQSSFCRTTQKHSHLSSLLITICVEYLFSSCYFQPIGVFVFKVNLLENNWNMLLKNSLCQPLPFNWLV